MGKKPRSQSRRVPLSVKSERHPDVFFKQFPQLLRFKELMDMASQDLLDELENLAQFDAARRHVFRFAFRSVYPDNLQQTDDCSGAAIFGFSSPTEIQQNLGALASLRAGEVWSVACLAIPFADDGMEPIFVFVLCDEKGNLAGCVALNRALQWHTFDSVVLSTAIAVTDPDYEPSFFEDTAAKLINDFPRLSRDAPETATLVAEWLRREIRVLADIDAAEFARVTERILGATRKLHDSLKFSEQLILGLQEARDKALKHQGNIELERRSAASARARSESLERELRALKQTQRGATSVSPAPGNLKTAVDRILGL